jgi:hypothetical protein
LKWARVPGVGKGHVYNYLLGIAEEEQQQQQLFVLVKVTVYFLLQYTVL